MRQFARLLARLSLFTGIDKFDIMVLLLWAKKTLSIYFVTFFFKLKLQIMF